MPAVGPLLYLVRMHLDYGLSPFALLVSHKLP